MRTPLIPISGIQVGSERSNNSDDRVWKDYGQTRSRLMRISHSSESFILVRTAQEMYQPLGQHSLKITNIREDQLTNLPSSSHPDLSLRAPYRMFAAIPERRATSATLSSISYSRDCWGSNTALMEPTLNLMQGPPFLTFALHIE